MKRAKRHGRLDTIDKVLEYLDFALFVDYLWFFEYKKYYRLGIFDYFEFWEAVMRLPWLFSIANIFRENENQKLIWL